MPGTGDGLFTARPSLGKSTVDFLIIPKTDQIDALMSSPHPDMDLFAINSRRVTKFLKHFYYVKYTYKVEPRQTGVIYKASITETTKIPVNFENPEKTFEGHTKAEWYPFEETPEVDEQFIMDLSRATGAGTALPKRLYGTAVAIPVKKEEETIPIILNIAEAFLYMQDNPDSIRGVLILPEYKYAVIILDEMSFDDLIDEILDNTTTSIRTFRTTINRTATLLAGAEEE